MDTDSWETVEVRTEAQLRAALERGNVHIVTRGPILLTYPVSDPADIVSIDGQYVDPSVYSHDMEW